MSLRTSLAIVATSALAVAACHSAKPAPAVAPARAVNADSIEGAARARRAVAARDAARLDSIARSKAAADEAARRAREAADAARTSLGDVIHFDYDKDEVLPASAATLDAKAELLKLNRAVRLRIEGNTDERGSDEYNLALGQRRAAAAKRYLVARGIEENRLETVSYGEERPLCRDGNESCWSQNRRDAFSIIAGGETVVSLRR